MPPRGLGESSRCEFNRSPYSYTNLFLLLNLQFLRPTDICDYLVMSTHKWMGNVKTAGLVVYADRVAPPLPHAVSFGYDGAMLNGGETAVQVSPTACDLV